MTAIRGAGGLLAFLFLDADEREEFTALFQAICGCEHRTGEHSIFRPHPCSRPDCPCRNLHDCSTGLTALTDLDRRITAFSVAKALTGETTRSDEWSGE